MDKKKIIYIDMDNTLAAYSKKAEEFGFNPEYAKRIEGFFKSLEPMPGAIQAYNELSKYFDVYILTTAPWSNSNALVEKMEWIHKYLPNAYKNVIFSHHKELNLGDYLIDDSTGNGAAEFKGKHIQIGSKEFPNWESVISYIFFEECIE